VKYEREEGTFGEMLATNFSLKLKTSPPSLLFKEEEKKMKPLFEEGLGRCWRQVTLGTINGTLVAMSAIIKDYTTLIYLYL